MPVAKPVRTSDLINSLGVVSHINYTTSQYKNIDGDLKALKYLGVTHIREAAPNPNGDIVGRNHLDQAAETGMKFTFLARASVAPETIVSRIHDFAVKHPGSVFAIEGPNEVNNFPVNYGGKTGTAAAQAYQKALFASVNADLVLKNIPVLNFTDYPGHTGVADWNNLHPYTKNGDNPGSQILKAKTGAAAIDAGRPFAITEGGYHTSLAADTHGGWEGVDEKTQAKFSLNFYMDASLYGAKLTHLYELLDEWPDKTGANQESHFGLFRLDFSAKPAATAVHNLTTLLADTAPKAASFITTSLDYTVSGLPATGHTYLTQKSTGTYQIIAWAEPDIWDQIADRPIAAPTSTATIKLAKTFATVQVFDPIKGTGAVQTQHNVSTLKIAITDHPVIVQLSGSASTSAVPTAEPANAALDAATSVTLIDSSRANSLKGKAGDDVIKGMDGDDHISGKCGNDTLHGGRGNDILKGGAGDDKFVFDTALDAKSNVDCVAYVSPSHDKIVLDDAVFHDLATGALPVSQLTLGSVAHDANDRVVYEQHSGSLFYDSNGSVAGGQTLFATIENHPALTASDFLVI